MTTSFYGDPPDVRLAQLRANRAEHEHALEALLPELDRANERLERVRAEHDEAAAVFHENQRARSGPSHGPGETWSTGAIDRKRAAAERDAGDVSSAYELARDALQAALRARNALDQRRSAHSQQIRLSDNLIAQTEAELEREQAKETRQRGALERIRARIAG